MTITDSYGYPGSFTADPVKWAKMQNALGAIYGVPGPGDLLATPVAAGTRQVKLAAGACYGQGVYDESDGETVQLPVTTTGTRYWLIVARRTWGTTNKTTIAIIDAGTNVASLPTRNTIPGVLDDQPLWLVPMTAGQSVPGTPIDLRVISTAKGYLTARSELVMQYLTGVGTQLRIGTTTWRRLVNGTNGAYWERDLGLFGRVGLTVLTQNDVVTTTTTGVERWTNVASGPNEAVLDGNGVDLYLDLRLYAGTVTADGAGGLVDDRNPDGPMATLKPALCPDRELQVACTVFGGSTTASGGTYTGLLRIFPTGTIFLCSLQPNVTVYRPAAGSSSLRAHTYYTKRTATP